MDPGSRTRLFGAANISADRSPAVDMIVPLDGGAGAQGPTPFDVPNGERGAPVPHHGRADASDAQRTR